MERPQRCFELLQAGDEAGIRSLLDQDRSLANVRDAGGISLLMQALYRGRGDLAQSIADKKQELDIFEAAALGRTELLKRFVADQSLVSAFSADGFSALHFACYFRQPGAAQILLTAGANAALAARNPTQVMPLHSAASARNLEAARLLLEYGAPVNARQQGGWTPLHAAAQNGDGAMVELLLLHGADPRMTNDQGRSPAEIAREKGHREIAELLEK